MTCRELIAELQKLNDLDKEVLVETKLRFNEKRILKDIHHNLKIEIYKNVTIIAD